MIIMAMGKQVETTSMDSCVVDLGSVHDKGSNKKKCILKLGYMGLSTTVGDNSATWQAIIVIGACYVLH
jgi:hypothetical protein